MTTALNASQRSCPRPPGARPTRHQAYRRVFAGPADIADANARHSSGCSLDWPDVIDMVPATHAILAASVRWTRKPRTPRPAPRPASTAPAGATAERCHGAAPGGDHQEPQFLAQRIEPRRTGRQCSTRPSSAWSGAPISPATRRPLEFAGDVRYAARSSAGPVDRGGRPASPEVYATPTRNTDSARARQAARARSPRL